MGSNTWHALKQFLIRRRILLSAILFVLVVVEDVVVGTTPHDLINLRDPLTVLGGSLVLMGLALRSWAAGVLQKDRVLVTSGPYRLIRNPLYVGSFLMMAGFCQLIGDLDNFWLLLGPVIVMYTIKVRQEERWLSLKFPAEWENYVRVTPRFIPRLSRVKLGADWQLTQWIRSREYQALLATCWALIAIKVWHLYATSS